eukprot:135223-Heterocapsa_arctica.AAC.1
MGRSTRRPGCAMLSPQPWAWAHMDFLCMGRSHREALDRVYSWPVAGEEGRKAKLHATLRA